MCGIAGTIFSRNNKFRKKVTTDDLHKIVQSVIKKEKSINNLLKVCWDYKSNVNFLRFFKSDNERQNIKNVSEEILKISKYYLKIISNIDKINNVKEFNKKYKEYESILDCYWFLNKELPSIVKSISYFDNCNNILNDQNIIFYKKLVTTINAIDNRLEFRGRDSLGISIQLIKNNHIYSFDNYVSNDESEQFYCENINGSTICTFIFKTANAVGSLGDNAKVVKKLIKKNKILNELISNNLYDGGSIVIHTRWASVGEVNIYNCHPISNVIDNKSDIDPLVLASMNGDVYNYKDILSSLNNHDYNSSIKKSTNDCIVFPLTLTESESFGIEAVSNIINTFSGSYTVALQSSKKPGSIILCSNGNQGLYIGIADDDIMFASDVYGLIESCKYFYPIKPGSILDLSYDTYKYRSNNLISIDNIKTKETYNLNKKDLLITNITTRDIHKGKYAHFLEKEIRETKDIVFRTILNYLQNNNISNIQNIIAITEKQVPAKIIDNFKNNQINKIIITGMGTCYTAASAIAMYMRHILRRYFYNIQIEPHIATEASAFYLKQNMDDTLVIAVAQSGTTIDTNVFVQKAKERGASSLAIANKREGDVTFLVDGTLYIGTGRDIEIAVPSTKTYTAQIILGYILTIYISSQLDILNNNDKINILKDVQKLRNVPKLIDSILNIIDNKHDLREQMKICCYYKSWYIAHDDSPNSVCAMEARIKFSEGCYHSLPYMHIDSIIKYKIKDSFILYITNKLTGDIIVDLKRLNKLNNYVMLIIDSNDLTLLNDIINQKLIYTISIPNTDPYYSFIPAIIVCQMLSYYSALALDDRKKYFYNIKQNIYNNKQIEYNSNLLIQSVNNGLFNEGFCKPQFIELINEINSKTNKSSNNYNNQLIIKNITEDLYSFAKRPIDTIKHQAKTITVGTVRDSTQFIHNSNSSEFINDTDFKVKHRGKEIYEELLLSNNQDLNNIDQYNEIMIYVDGYESFYANYILDFLNTINYKYNLGINFRITKYYDSELYKRNKKQLRIYIFNKISPTLRHLLDRTNKEPRIVFDYRNIDKREDNNRKYKEILSNDMYYIMKSCFILFKYFTKDKSTNISNYISDNIHTMFYAADYIRTSPIIADNIKDAANIYSKKMYWKCIGSGTNYNIAKYASMKLINKFNRACAFDVLENHKHIDISAESVILTFIANIWRQGYQSDIYPEIEKLISHNNIPIIITNLGDERFDNMRMKMKYTYKNNVERIVPIIKIPNVDEIFAFPLNELIVNMFIKELNNIYSQKCNIYNKIAFDSTIQITQ